MLCLLVTRTSITSWTQSGHRATGNRPWLTSCRRRRQDGQTLRIRALKVTPMLPPRRVLGSGTTLSRAAHDLDRPFHQAQRTYADASQLVGGKADIAVHRVPINCAAFE